MPYDCPSDGEEARDEGVCEGRREGGPRPLPAPPPPRRFPPRIVRQIADGSGASACPYEMRHMPAAEWVCPREQRRTCCRIGGGSSRTA